VKSNKFCNNSEKKFATNGKSPQKLKGSKKLKKILSPTPAEFAEKGQKRMIQRVLSVNFIYFGSPK